MLSHIRSMRGGSLSAGGVDTTPDAFSFVDRTGVATGSTIVSDPITVTGINSPATITVSGGTYDINGSGSFVSTSGTVNNGDTVRAAVTSSGSASTATSVTVTIGGVSDTFSATTMSGAPQLVTLGTPSSGQIQWNPTTAYAGAFRVPIAPGGAASGLTAYSNGAMAYNPTNDSIFIGGHRIEELICEINIPTLVAATAYANLNTLNIGSVRQTCAQYDARGTGVDAGDHEIAGMYCDGTHLLITSFENYAQSQSFKSVFRVVRTASNISGSTVDGYFDTAIDSGAGGWISPIPSLYQSSLGGTHLTGFSNSGANRSSTQSLSMGPAAYAADITSLMNNSSSTSAGTVLSQTPLCRFRLEPYGMVLDSQLYNAGNGLWTALSEISYGLIIPGTRTYALFGSMSMYSSGGWYGQNTTRPGGVPYDSQFENQGPHPYDPDDWDYWYWFIDVNDLIAVKNGTKQAHQVVPYEYGVFPMPLDRGTGTRFVGGGALRTSNNQLLLSLRDLDSTQGISTAPTIVAFNLPQV